MGPLEKLTAAQGGRGAIRDTLEHFIIIIWHHKIMFPRIQRVKFRYTGVVWTHAPLEWVKGEE